jgi:hypothetical protein
MGDPPDDVNIESTSDPQASIEPYGRLGQQKMMKINELTWRFATARQDITDVVYVGAYGPDTFPVFAQLFNNQTRLYLRAYDPQFNIHTFKELRSKYVRIMQKKFSIRSWVQDFRTQRGGVAVARDPNKLLFYDDSMLVPKSDRSKEGRSKAHLRHFTSVLGWLNDVKPRYAVLKVPKEAADLALQGYRCMCALDDPVIEGRVLEEKRVFVVAEANSVVEFGKLDYQPWPESAEALSALKE